MDPILELLKKDSRYTAAQIAEMLDLPEADVSAKIAAWEADGTVLGYQAVIDQDRVDIDTGVTAFIEVKITPERGGGFDSLAEQVSKFDQVSSCYLMSGGYDLLVVVEGKNLRECAEFVSRELSTMQGVLSTATHFQLQIYKQNGLLTKPGAGGKRIAVSP